MVTEKTENKKKLALDIMLSRPELSFGQMAELIGISDKTFWRFRQDEDFKAAYNAACRAQFEAIQALAITKLRELCESGNFNAVKYALDGNNYAATQKLDISSDIKINIGGNDNEDN